MVNSPEPTEKERIPNPLRMLNGYFCAASTLNLVRAFVHGGYAALDYVKEWHSDLCNTFPANPKYEELVSGIRKAINFMNAIGFDINSSHLNQANLYTSHEALLLDYEEALTRIDTITGYWYDTSAHMIWIGVRTRQLNGAHVEFLRGVCNSLGIKIGPNYDLDEIKQSIERLNPENYPGRLTLITRFGANKVENFLPPLIKGIISEGYNIAWVCDPMHGNTYQNQFLKKTRKY